MIYQHANDIHLITIYCFCSLSAKLDKTIAWPVSKNALKNFLSKTLEAECDDRYFHPNNRMDFVTKYQTSDECLQLKVAT